VFFEARPARLQNALPPGERVKYLSLPSGLSNRVAQLAKSWVGDADDPLVQSRLVEQRLRRDYRYDLESPSGAAQNPMEDFLFNSRRGHCEYYATAMAILLRTLGIPTRNVTGFGAATFNRFGWFYVVRQSDAHSWVEAWVDGMGWSRFDPTPPQAPTATGELGGVGRIIGDLIEAVAQRWSRHVEAYDMQQQIRLVGQLRSQAERMRGSGRIGRWVSIRTLLLGSILVLIGFRLRRFVRMRKSGRRRADTIHAPLAPSAKLAIQLYQELEQVLTENGIPRPLGTPPLGYANLLGRMGHPLADRIAELTQLYLEARFGDRPLLPSEVADFHHQLSLLRQLSSRGRAA
jgi:hypothetical protein